MVCDGFERGFRGVSVLGLFRMVSGVYGVYRSPYTPETIADEASGEHQGFRGRGSNLGRHLWLRFRV